ncbi:hypothetical protein ACF05W_09655 [Streptomyces lydicus]|uniref:hypothetical protein n=1 Tax=Streptomyces lydicus TaxID=47763 RepID=UPI0036F55EB5
MTDRRRRAALLLPPPATAGWYPQATTTPGAVLLPRERKSSSSKSSSPASAGSDRDNPFAPPPAGAPDQEWQPRHPAPHTHGQDPAQGHDQGQGQGHGQGQGSHGGQGGQGGDQGQSPQGEPTRNWGSQWSPRQPGRQSGDFGTRPGGRNGQPNGGPGGPGGLRWDPTDPAQRRARYALLAGMWAFFFALFSLPEVSLLLGVLAIYWGISSLRAKPDPAKATAAATTAAMEGRPTPGATAGNPVPGATDGHPAPGGASAATPDPLDPRPAGAPPTPAAGTTRPQVTAAIAGLVTASLALMMVAATFTVQLVYRDYFTCVNDALTQSSSKSCENLLPKELRPLLSVQE